MGLIAGIAVLGILVSFYIAYRRFIFRKQLIFVGVLFGIFFMLYFGKGIIAKSISLEQAGIMFATIINLMDVLFFKYVMMPLSIIFSLVKLD